MPLDIFSRDPHDIRIILTQQYSSMEVERSTWLAHYQDLNRFILPRSGRYLEFDRNRTSTSKYNAILDSSATQNVRTAKSGLSTGMSSPARIWFKLRAKDPELNRYQPVRIWLDEVVERMMQVLAGTNVYRDLDRHYGDLLVYGTSCSIQVSDFETVIHHYPSPVGEFLLGQDNKGRVNTLFRRFNWTTGEVVMEFGRDAVSESVRQNYDRGNHEAQVTLLHAIRPRYRRDPGKIDNQNMPWESIYMEWGNSAKRSGLLRVSGFERFPVLAPRWEPNGMDVYGGSPGMDVLGDVKQLQHEQQRKGQVIDHQTDPALALPAELQDQEVETFPGGRVYVSQLSPHTAIRPLFEVNLNLDAVREDILDVRGRIARGLFEPLFLMLANMPPTRESTAYEIAARKEEQMLQLGPVLSNLRTELHSPLVQGLFHRMLDIGMFPPIPRELQGSALDIEYVGLLDQAQKIIGVQNMERFTSSLAAASEFKPEVLDKWNADEWADDLADRLGVPADQVVSDEKVRALRAARAAAQAAQAQVEAMKTQSEAARNFSQAQAEPRPPTSGDPTSIAEAVSSPSGI